MPPIGRDAIQQGLASKDAERSKMSDSTPVLNKFTMKERESVDCADTVHMQSCEEDRISLVLPRIG